MEEQQLKQVIMRELPAVIQHDPEVQEFIVQLARQHFADRQETESRFDRLLEELRRDREREDRKWEANQQELRRMREESERKWEEQNRKWEANQQELRRMREESERKWEEQNRKWEANQQELCRMREESERKWEEQNRKWEANQQELRRMREESERKWEEQNRKWEEQNRKWEANQQELRRMREESERKWEEQNRKWEEQNRKWEENQQVIRKMLADIRRLDTTIGALGARWGLYTEQSFRNALRGILEEEFQVEVLNVVEYDEAGEVFGRPDQIELDLIIRDGTLVICEIKSSMSKGDMYLFERKARFYEKRHGKQASQLVVISPMVDEQAKTVAERLGIRVYSHAEDLDPEILA